MTISLSSDQLKEYWKKQRVPDALFSFCTAIRGFSTLLRDTHPCSKNTVLFRACQGPVRHVTMLSWKASLPDSKSFCVLIFAIGYVMIYPPLLLRLSIISTISVLCVSSAKSRLSPFDWNRRLNFPAFSVYYLLTTSPKLYFHRFSVLRQKKAAL